MTALMPQTAFQHHADIQLPGNVAHRHRLRPGRDGRRPRRYPDIRDAAKLVDQFLRQAFGQIILFGGPPAKTVDRNKWQHGHRARRRCEALGLGKVAGTMPWQQQREQAEHGQTA